MERDGADALNFACDECRARKLKCSRSRPRCSFCVKGRKTCSYSTRRQRVPLTRAYVTGLEERVKSLEQLLRKSNLDGDLDNASATLVAKEPALHHQLTSLFLAKEEPRRSVSGPPGLSARIPPRPSTPESLPHGSNGFDWGEPKNGDLHVRCQETPDASASADGIGYLGKSSNVALLRALHQVGNLWRNPPVRQPTYPSHLQPAGEFSNIIPLPMLEHPETSDGFADFLIDSYFKHFHTTYPLLHEATFRAQYSEVLPRPPQEAWKLLSRAVFAIGAWCAGCRISNADGKEAKSSFEPFQNIELLRAGCLCRVQGLTLLGVYMHKQNKLNSSSMYMGAAVKMAISLGLHREFPEWNISLLDREMRRRAWWCLYVLESGNSMAMGRLILLPRVVDMDTKPPLNISEQSLTARTTIQPPESSGLTPYSNLRAQIEFHLMVNDQYNTNSHSTLEAKDILNMGAAIDSWTKSLPAYVQQGAPSPPLTSRLDFAIHHLLWRTGCMKISLFFPCLVGMIRRSGSKSPEKDVCPEDKQKAVFVCVDYAQTMLESIEGFFARDVSNPLKDWYARYCLIQSALVFVQALQSSFDFPKEWRARLIPSLDKIMTLLAKVSEHDQFAKSILDILSQVRTNHNQEESDMTGNGLLDYGMLDVYPTPWDEGLTIFNWNIWDESFQPS